MLKAIQFGVIASALIAMGGTVGAAESKDNDAVAVAASHISMVQAVTAAETYAKGKASRAEYENSKKGWVYDVEVVNGKKVFDVKVDAQKGTVLSVDEDKTDHDDDHDKTD